MADLHHHQGTAEPSPDSQGQSETPAMDGFLRKIGPMGSAIFLILFVLYFAVCFSQGRDLLKNYEAPHDNAYYAVHIPELVTELDETVKPMLEGIRSVSCSEDGNTAVIEIEKEDFFPVRRSLYRHFNRELLTLVELEDVE